MPDTWDDESLDMNVVALLRQLPDDDERQRLLDCLSYVHLRTHEHCGELHRDPTGYGLAPGQWDDWFVSMSTGTYPHDWHEYCFDNVAHTTSMIFEEDPPDAEQE